MELIYVKDVDKSLLYQGFTIKTALLDSFLGFFGKLAIGEVRQISILLNGNIYSGIRVINQNFDRNKYPDHPEMYQVRYDNMHGFLQALRSEFSGLYHYINEQMQIKKMMKERGESTPNIKIPKELKASLSFYTTDNPNIWEAVSITTNDFNEARKQISVLSMNESLFENMLLTDVDATIIEEPHFVKVRKLDRNVCLNLKKLYCYRCQICGQQISASYGDKPVIDAHHIDYFTKSLNNNYSNVLIVCPNHHRIIHAYNPVFKVQNKEFVYPNGYKEGLVLNMHL